jgi:hypothetical protein
VITTNLEVTTARENGPSLNLDLDLSLNLLV